MKNYLNHLKIIYKKNKIICNYKKIIYFFNLLK